MKEIILRRANMHSGNLILVNARYAYQGQATEDLVALADEGVSGKRREAAGTAIKRKAPTNFPKNFT